MIRFLLYASVLLASFSTIESSLPTAESTNKLAAEFLHLGDELKSRDKHSNTNSSKDKNIGSIDSTGEDVATPYTLSTLAASTQTSFTHFYLHTRFHSNHKQSLFIRAPPLA